MPLARRRFVFLLVAVAATLLGVPGTARADLAGFEWSSIGPEPACCFFPGGESGRATAIAVNPLNKNDVWIGTAGGGVWHSTNGGSLWTPMSDDQLSLAIGSIALAGCSASHCTAVYAGTGENAIRRDTYYGAGLLVGAYDGTNVVWTRRFGGPTYNFSRGSITNVVLDPTTSGPGQVLYITLSSGVTASATESTVTAPEPKGGYGIYKSTDDGVTFTKVFADGKPTDLEMSANNHVVLYAGVLGKGVYRTTNSGALWCPLNPGIPQPFGCNVVNTGLINLNNWTIDHVEIATDPAEPAHLYATFGLCSNPLLDNCAPALYDTPNGGNTWTQRYGGQAFHYLLDGTPPCPFGYTRYTHALTVDPSNPGAVFVGGVHLCRWTQGGPGDGWSEKDASTQPCTSNPIGPGTATRCTVHSDHRAVVFAPSDPQRAYNANDGGIAVSNDGGMTWTAKNDGLGIMEFQSIASSPFSDSVIGGAQDNAGMEWVGSWLWNHLECCGDGGFAVMENDSTPVAKQDDLYVTSNTGDVDETIVLPIRSKNGGALFEYDPQLYNYDNGLKNEDPRSFYPPLIEDQTSALYFGADALYRSTDGSQNYTAVSPVLSTLDQPEIVGGKDVISAVAVAPTNANHVYLGFYSGKTYFSTSPCSGNGCWTAGTTLMGPVTWIAVDPGNENTAYATVSGFGAGSHVYRTTSGGQTWDKRPSARGLAGLPANTLLVDPSNSSALWLGTDRGVWRSTNGGYAWTRFSNGLPNAPVYAFTLAGSPSGLIAATHGRGAWKLKGLPKLRGWVDGPNPEFIIEEAVLGDGFPPDQPCTLTITREDGTVCATGPRDALGGTVTSDSRGFLVSSKAGFFVGQPIVWACAQGKCLDQDATICNKAGNAMGAVQASCGGQTARDERDVSSADADPPSALLALGFLAGSAEPGLGTGEEPDDDSEAGPPVAAPGGSFTLAPAVQSGDGAARRLCSIDVTIGPNDTSALVLQRATDALNGDAACRAAGVSAAFQSGDRGGMVEDEFPVLDRLMLEAPLLTGSRLVPAIRTTPGGATGRCFQIGKIDRPSESRLLGMRLRFTTGTNGAAGGAIHMTERSSLGECTIALSIPGSTPPAGIAQAVAAAFQASGIPGPHPHCPSRVNPRDVTAQGNSILTTFASEVEVCVDDAGIGVALAPEGICDAPADCDDGNPCTADTCHIVMRQCVHLAVPDGAPCTDSDQCTTGNTCSGGVCGARVVCNDGNACTTDACDPATGACVAPPVLCDDGNACTQDRCVTTTGQCAFTSMAGTACDDGDPCTSGEVCIVPTGGTAPVCSGALHCADSDPCTDDQCDPGSGACSYPPIECDDGDPCTVDLCQAGACVANVVTGVACDDDNLCTTGDMCLISPASGLAVCSGTPTSCDDGFACTLDSCDPISGACAHSAAPVGSVTPLQFLDNARLDWPSAREALSYNSYRGTIPTQGLGSRPPAARYDQTCFEANDAAGDGATLSTDPAIPPLGTAFSYFASVVATCDEGPIGADSNGTLVPNAAPCPAP